MRNIFRKAPAPPPAPIPTPAWSPDALSVLVALLALALLRRCFFRSNSEPAWPAEPDEEESIEEIRLDKLPAAITAMRENAADDRLLAAGDLLTSIRAAVTRNPSARAAAAAASALEEEVRPGMTTRELARRHAECKDALRLLRRASDGSCGGSGWQLLSESEGTSTFVKRSDGMLWAKAVGEVGGSGGAPPVPLFRVLALFRQTELFDHWYPRCVEARTLATPGACERLFRIVIEVRIPVIGKVSYDLMLHAYGVDALGTHGGFLICGRSPRQLDWLKVPFPPPPKGGVRQDLAALRLFITPLPGGRTHASICTAIDTSKAPAVKLVPRWAIDWLISHIVGKIFSAQAACAQQRVKTALCGVASLPTRSSSGERLWL